MGNSGWCTSKNTEVEYNTREPLCEFTVDKKAADKAKDTKMEAIIDEMALKLTNKDLPTLKTDKPAPVQPVSFWVINSSITCLPYHKNW